MAKRGKVSYKVHPRALSNRPFSLKVKKCTDLEGQQLNVRILVPDLLLQASHSDLRLNGLCPDLVCDF